MAHLRTAAVLASLALAGCKHDAPPDLRTGNASAPASAAPSASAEHAHNHEMQLPPVGPTVKVTFDGKSVDVALSSVAAADGAPGFVSVSKLWATARPGEDPAPLVFDFVGSDGFRSRQRAKCEKLLHGRDLAAARLEATTHNLVFAEGSTLPGCYRVKAVVAVEVKRDP